ncbi:hypothetical protein [Dyella sp. A6]|uniref:iron chaperone n=1 Tax=Dyella aluminiiresistens TaxID=3069105 RepID=UPI002E75F785|nr:hypothetical protein [Dyella sp. A6]
MARTTPEIRSPAKAAKKAVVRRRAETSTAGFSAEERAAMRERTRETKASARRGADGERDVLDKIASMPEPDREMAGRLHALLKVRAPMLVPRTWYGMPAYARDGKILCFFQSSQKFGTRYATLGFSDKAGLDDGAMWPTAFALTAWTPAVEKRIAALIVKAVG